MFAKLAFRNVRRQLGNYLIYFITVSLTVSFMFAMCNVIFSEQLMDFAENISELKSLLIALAVFVALIVSFVLGYATSFMLRLRKREFGTYLTLGMTRSDILAIFILETLLLCAAALAAGIAVGLLVYQALMALITRLMEMPMTVASYSAKGLVFTVILVCSMFVLSSLTSVVYLRKVSIYELLQGDRKVGRGVKHPVLWFIVTLLSLAALIWSCYYFAYIMEATFTSGLSDSESMSGMLLSITVLAVSVILFHIGLSRSLVHLLCRNKRICARGTNTFVFRQLSGKLGANSVMSGILAFLITFAIVGANFSIGQKTTTEQSLNCLYPFDISAGLSPSYDNGPTYEEALKIIEKYSKIKETIPYSTYTSGNNDLHSLTIWSGEGYDGLYDTFMKESDFNRLLAGCGYEPVSLTDDFLILSRAPQAMQIDAGSTELELNGVKYTCREVTDHYPIFSDVYFIAVVPDAAVVGMEIDGEHAEINLESRKYDATALKNELIYTVEMTGGYNIELCDYDIKEYARIRENSVAAMFIVGELFVSVIFLFMAMAVLALKILSGLSEDRHSFEVLYRLGTDEREQSRALFRQIFSFFFIPYFLPVALSVPTAFIFGKLVTYGGLSELTGQIYTNSAAIAILITAVYLLYFTATYFIAKRGTICTGEVDK